MGLRIVERGACRGRRDVAPTRAEPAPVRSPLGTTMAAGLLYRLAVSERESATGMAVVWAGIPEDAPNHPWRSSDRGVGSAVCLGANGLVRGSPGLNPITQIIRIDSPQPAYPE
jgi:hypothetical protein